MMNLCPLDSIPVCSAIVPLIFILLPFSSSLHKNLIFYIVLNEDISSDFYILFKEEFTSPFNFDKAKLRFFYFSWPLWNKEPSFSVKENFYLILN